MGRHSHDCARAVAREHILADPDWNCLACEWVYSIRAGEDTSHLAVADAVALGALLHIVDVFADSLLLLGCCHLCDIVAFRRKHHECHAKHSVGACGEDCELHVGILYREFNLSTFGTSDPVLLSLLYRVAPVYSLKTVEQSLGVCADTQAPLAHLLLHHWESATHRHSIDNLVVGKHSAELWTPVHHRLADVCDAVVHEHLLLLNLVP